MSGFKHYNLPGVKPWVLSAANLIGTLFDITTIYGVGARPDAGSEHPLGLALDFMVYSDQAKGEALANYAMQNAKALDIYYIMWNHHIWDIQRDAPGVWREVPDRGSPTANHEDHVHISFNATAGSTPIPDPGNMPGIEGPLGPDGLPAVPKALKDAVPGLDTLQAIFNWISNGHNWYRLLLVVAGAGLIAFSLLKFDSVSNSVSAASSALGKVK